MTTPKALTLWANELLAQAIEGASDAFLITAGGSAVMGGGAAAVSVTPRQLAISVALGAALYVAAFLKKHPTPAAYAAKAQTSELKIPQP